MAPRVKIYEENELFHAGDYLKVLEGSPYQPDENVLKYIKELFTLRKAAIASKYATLTFTGMVSDTQATLEVFFHDRQRGRWQITVTAYVGDYKKSIEDIEYCLSIGFPDFMDWIKSVIPYKRNLPLEPGQNAAPELWYETESGKKFISQMKEIGFASNLDSKYGNYTPLQLDKEAHDKLVPLVYNDDLGHFRLADPDHDVNASVGIKMNGKEARVWLYASMSELMEKQFNCPIHIFDPNNGMEPDKFVEEVKKLLKFNEDRIDKIAADNGGLTWKGIDFSTRFHDKLARPEDFNKLPKKDRDRINEHLAKFNDKRLIEYDEYFKKSKFANLYNYIKEHGEISLYPSQFGNEHHIEFRIPLVLEEPINYGESFNTHKVSITGSIYVKDKQYESWSGVKYYPDSVRIHIPVCYYTDKGDFASWEEAIAAGSNTEYGGACYIDGCKVPRGKSAFSSLSCNQYWHDNSYISDEELKRFEHILMNVKDDYGRYLVACHLIEPGKQNASKDSA